MWRWWDVNLFVLVVRYLRELWAVVMAEFRRDRELRRWRRQYERMPQAEPQESAHPITRALGSFSAPVVTPLITPARRGESGQLDLF